MTTSDRTVHDLALAVLRKVWLSVRSSLTLNRKLASVACGRFGNAARGIRRSSVDKSAGLTRGVNKHVFEISRTQHRAGFCCMRGARNSVLFVVVWHKQHTPTHTHTCTPTIQILLDTGVFGGVSDSELDSWPCALPCSWAARETQATVECLDDAVRAVAQDPHVAHTHTHT